MMPSGQSLILVSNKKTLSDESVFFVYRRASLRTKGGETIGEIRG